MNASYIYEWMTAVAGHLKNGANGSAADIIEALKAEAAAEIRRDEAKRSGTASRQKAAERIIKNAKSMQPSKPCLHGAWTENGAQCLCDSFRALRLSEPLPLENIPEDIEPLNVSRIIDGAKQNAGARLSLPDLGELRAHIKAEKARIKAEKLRGIVPLWDFGDGLPAVDAQYLADMLEALPGCTATASVQRPTLNALYITSEDGDGVLLPAWKAAKHG